MEIAKYGEERNIVLDYCGERKVRTVTEHNNNKNNNNNNNNNNDTNSSRVLPFLFPALPRLHYYHYYSSMSFPLPTRVSPCPASVLCVSLCPPISISVPHIVACPLCYYVSPRSSMSSLPYTFLVSPLSYRGLNILVVSFYYLSKFPFLFYCPYFIFFLI